MQSIFSKPVGVFPYCIADFAEYCRKQRNSENYLVFCQVYITFVHEMKQIFFLLLAVISFSADAQARRNLLDSLHYRVELQATLTSGDHTPLWLNANRYGLSSLKTANGYLRGAVERPLSVDADRRWGIGYGVDVAVAAGFTSVPIVHQAFAEARWLKGVLTVGAKEYPMELKNQELSSGSQTFGINARPIPQARVALPDYWTVPYTRGWLALKGHLAYGKPTDSRWQKDFTGKKSKYVEGSWYHSKAGYLRIGPKNITLELGLEMACQFGGKSYNVPKYGDITENKSDLKAFWDAFVGSLSGGDARDGEYWQNASGNQLGSWVARLNLDFDKWYAGLYADHYFEDHSAMFFLDYDGYGTGADWNVKEKSRYFRYDLKDIMLGLEVQLKQFRWLDHIVVEYLHTKYQSGPVYHDHTPHISGHISGRDNYYNHSILTGWQHWGQVMGNPLYLSPLYNDNGVIKVYNNRFVAWHLGLSGQPADQLHYRLLATWQRGYGTYDVLYNTPRENVSLMAEATYLFPKGWHVKAALGMDSGKIYGDNYGIQLSIIKSGIFTR